MTSTTRQPVGESAQRAPRSRLRAIASPSMHVSPRKRAAGWTPEHPSRFALSADASGAAVIDQSAATLTRDLLEQDEVIILLLRPSLWYVLLASLASLGMIALLTFMLAYMSHLPWAQWNDVQAFALGVGLGSLRMGWQWMEWMSRVYVLTDRRVVSRGGVLRTIVFQAPLKNIQHTAVFASMRERLFGLGTLGFATAGSDTFDTLWLMIRSPQQAHKTVVEAVRRYGV